MSLIVQAPPPAGAPIAAPHSKQPVTDQVVRVWFGDHKIAEYAAEPVTAQRYAEAMKRRFAGLRVTIDPPSVQASARPAPVAAELRAPVPPPLPGELLWGLIP